MRFFFDWGVVVNGADMVGLEKLVEALTEKMGPGREVTGVG
jgi:hypothetical protein